MLASRKKSLIEQRWAFAAVISGFLVGFFSAYLCIIWHLVIFGFNIMYIVSPLIAGLVETIIARRKYGRSTGAISALLTFILINVYGWLLPGTLVDPTKEPATLSLITIIAIILTIQAAFPTLINYILLVVGLGTVKKLMGFLIFLPYRIQRRHRVPTEKEIITGPGPDETFLDELTLPLLSIPDLEGRRIKKNIGLVTGLAVAEEKKSGGRLSKIIEPVQIGNLNLGEARKAALSRMLENAESQGANTVVEVLIDYVSMSGLQGGAIIVTATGTAVITE